MHSTKKDCGGYLKALLTPYLGTISVGGIDLRFYT